MLGTAWTKVNVLIDLTEKQFHSRNIIKRPIWCGLADELLLSSSWIPADGLDAGSCTQYSVTSHGRTVLE